MPEIDTNPNPTPVPETPAAAEAPASSEPYAVFKDAASFQKRVDQSTRAALRRELGIDDVDALKAKLSAAEKYEAEREAARQAQLTNEQRLSEEISRLTREKEAAEQLARTREFEAHTTRLFSTMGIREHGYATFRLQEAQRAHKGEAAFDDKAFLESLLADPRARIQLGVDEVPAPGAPASTVDRPANTTLPAAFEAPKTPPAGAGPKQPSAFELTPAEWAARKQSYGGGF